ncbi:hypothetical protein E4U55_008142, partial [Claviceps digitariae]
MVQATDEGEPGSDDIPEAPYVLSSTSSIGGSGYFKSSTMDMAKSPPKQQLAPGPVTDTLVEFETTKS